MFEKIYGKIRELERVRNIPVHELITQKGFNVNDVAFDSEQLEKRAKTELGLKNRPFILPGEMLLSLHNDDGTQEHRLKLKKNRPPTLVSSTFEFKRGFNKPTHDILSSIRVSHLKQLYVIGFRTTEKESGSLEQGRLSVQTGVPVVTVGLNELIKAFRSGNYQVTKKGDTVSIKAGKTKVAEFDTLLHKESGLHYISGFSIRSRKHLENLLKIFCSGMQELPGQKLLPQ